MQRRVCGTQLLDPPPECGRTGGGNGRESRSAILAGPGDQRTTADGVDGEIGVEVCSKACFTNGLRPADWRKTPPAFWKGRRVCRATPEGPRQRDPEEGLQASRPRLILATAPRLPVDTYAIDGATSEDVRAHASWSRHDGVGERVAEQTDAQSAEVVQAAPSLPRGWHVPLKHPSTPSHGCATLHGCPVVCAATHMP
jgi:hypothetical protein